jgi:uncharacterized metal-binding protein YceD (DUF177 family)
MDKLKLKDLIRAGQREVTVRDAYEFEDLPVKNPVQVAAHCELNATGVKVSGHFDALIEDECDRCCEMFERRAKGNFEERFVYQALLDEIPGDKELQEEDYYETIGPDVFWISKT